MENNSPRKHVVVLGAGVVGLTTAIRLAQQYKVTIVAEKTGRATNSVHATAVWHVFLVKLDADDKEVEIGPDDIHLKWAEETLYKLFEWADVAGSGIEVIDGVELFRREPPDFWPAWMEVAKRSRTKLRLLTAAEISELNTARHRTNIAGSKAAEVEVAKKPIRYGYRISAPAADMSMHLDWLERQSIACGVSFQSQRVSGIRTAAAELSHLQPDAIVNCTGIEAKEFAEDGTFCGFEGQYFIADTDSGSSTEYIGDDDNPSGTDGVSGPDDSRVKEPLEAFPLDALDMVGTIGDPMNSPTALITDPSGSVHRLKPGNYLGQNDGQITAVYEDRVELVELVSNGNGGWMERPASIALDDE